MAHKVEEQGARYFGLDPILSFLLYAQNHRGLRHLVRGQGERLPFQDKSFDRVISGFSAYRNVNPGLGLPEAHRVLKTDGRLVFDLPNYWFLKLIELKKLIKKREWKKFRSFTFRLQSSSLDIFEFISFSQLKQKVEKANFLVEDIVSTPVTPIFPILNKYLSNFYYRDKNRINLGFDIIIVLKKA